jgi:putative PEP-CTERM system TPR-repeat lipoprotein
MPEGFISAQRPSDAPRRRSRVFLLAALLALTLPLATCEWSTSPADHIAKAQARRSAGDISAAIVEIKKALRQEPRNAATRLTLAQYFLDLPDPQSAEAELLRARQDGADAGLTLKLLLRTELLLGRSERVLAEATPPADASADITASVRAIKAEAYTNLGRMADAHDVLDAGLADAPRSVDLLTAMSRYALASGDLKAARGFLDKAQAEDPQNIALFDIAGTIAYAAQDLDGSVAAYKKMLAVAPWSIVARLGFARAQIAQGSVDDAKANLAAVLKAAPNDPRANYLQALAEYRDGDYLTAQSHLRRTLSVAPRFMPALLLAGTASYALNQYEQANAYLTQYLHDAPQDLAARKLLSAVQVSLGHSGEAVKTLAPVAETNGSDAEMLTLLGGASARSGDFAGASRYLGKVLEQDPNNSEVRIEWGIAEIALGRTEAGIAALQQANDAGAGEARADFALFIGYFRQQNYDDALKMAKRLQERQPGDAMGYDLAGAVHLARSDDDAARAEFLKAEALGTGDLVALRSLAELAQRKGDVPAAIGYLTDILKRNPRDAAAYLSLAALQYSSGQRDAARATLQEAVLRCTDQTGPRIALGRLLLSDHRYQEAAGVVGPAMTGGTKDPALLAVVGEAQLGTGDPAAINTLKQLVSVAPAAPSSHRLLAEAYLAAKQFAPAVSEAQQAVAAGPTDDAARITLARAYAAAGDSNHAAEVLTTLTGDAANAAVAELRARLPGAPQVVPGTPVEKAESGDGEAEKMRRALAQARLGNIDAAQKLLSEQIASHPDEVTPRNVLADIGLSQNRLDDALAQYETVLQKAPDDVIAENNLAWILHVQGNAGAALDHARHAALLAPRTPQVLDTLGVVLLDMHRASEAAETLERAATASPADALIQIHYAQALVGVGDKQHARQVLNTLLVQQPPDAARSDAETLLHSLGEGN